MGAFGTFTLTTKGLALQAKAQAGAALHYNRIGVGDGNLSGPIAPMNTLISEKKSLPISKLRTMLPGKAVVGATLSNQSITTGFYLREIGVFAQDPDIGEILYCYANAGVTADFIPAGGSGPDIIENEIDVVVLVGTAATITATVDSSLIFASQQELTTHATESTLDHPDGSVTTAKLAEKSVTGAKLADKGVGSGQLADGAATDTVIGNRTINDVTAPTGNTSSLTSLLSWIGNMIKSITGKSTWRTLPATTLEAAKTHMDTSTGAHGAVSTVAANTLMQRDANGRAKVAAPLAADDIARKDTIDNHVNTASGAHAATAISATGGTTVQAEIDGLKSSVSSGKSVLAAAITDMGQAASGAETFAQLATKVRDISDDATAAVGDVLAGKSFYQGGAKRTGSMPNRAGDTVALSSVVAGSTLKLLASAGSRNGVTDYVTITDSDWEATNIRSGVEMFGKTGTLIEGKRFAEGTLAQYLGESGSTNVSVSGLPFTPDLVIAHVTIGGVSPGITPFCVIWSASILPVSGATSTRFGSSDIWGDGGSLSSNGFTARFWHNNINTGCTVTWRAFKW